MEKNNKKGNEKLKEAIEFLRKNNKSGNSIITNKTDLIKIIITEIEKRLPRKCNDCHEMYTDNYSDTPKIKCFMCNIGRHNCHNSESEMDKAGWCWICVECRDLLIDDNMISAFKEDLSKKAEEKMESKTKKRKRISMDTVVTQPMKKDNNKKDNNKRSSCKECNGIIYSFCVGCTICPDTWFHLPCAGIESKKKRPGK